MTHRQRLFVRESSLFCVFFFLTLRTVLHLHIADVRTHTHAYTHLSLFSPPFAGFNRAMTYHSSLVFPRAGAAASRGSRDGLWLPCRKKESRSLLGIGFLPAASACVFQKKKKTSAELKLPADYRLSCRLKLSTLIMSWKECVVHTYVCN